MMNDDEEHDPLAQRLKREANAERPEFSESLHDDILRRVEESPAASTERKFPAYQAMIGAAAVILVSLAMLWSFIIFSRSPTPVELAKSAPTPRYIAFNLNSSVNLDGIASARIWPPEISIQLPASIVKERRDIPRIDSATTSDRSNPPQTLLATLQSPAQGATTELLNALPPNLRMMAEVVASGARR